MKITATQKYIRTSPRKISLVANSVKHLSPTVALSQLGLISNRPTLLITKAIKQALGNATNNLKLDENNLKISSIQVHQAPTLKRWRAVSRGRAHTIFKRASHIKVTLETITDNLATPKATAAKKSAAKAPITKTTKPLPSNVKTSAKPETITHQHPTDTSSTSKAQLPVKKNLGRQKKV